MTQTQSLAQTEARQLAERRAAEPMQRLDPYGAGGIAAQAGRLAPLAIVSLGFRQAGNGGSLGLPRATRREDEKWLHLHDADQRAPGLAAALKAGAHRHLTIAFPLDEPRLFIQQTFVRWSATALEVYGDAAGLNVIETRNGASQHRHITPDNPEFDRLVRTCKADTRMYFALAEWLPTLPDREPQSRVLFPDGFGWYCFRTTGRHTAAEIIGYLENFRSFTRGRLAGIPFDLTVVFREVAGPDGKKRTVPVANVVARPPERQVLDSQTFRILATAGLEQGRNLQLPALPSPEEIASEGPPELEEDVPEEAVRRLAAGDYPCDYNVVVRTWHAIVRGTPLEADESRALWLRQWSQGEFDSLTAVRQLTQSEATQMLADLADGVSDVREELDRAREEAQQKANVDAYNRTLGSADWGEEAPGAGPGLDESTQEGEAQPNTRDRSNASEMPSSPDPASESISTGEAEERAKNAKLLADAEPIGVKGLRQLTAVPSDSLARIRQKNEELTARIQSRNGELDSQLANPGSQALL